MLCSPLSFPCPHTSLDNSIITIFFSLTVFVVFPKKKKWMNGFYPWVEKKIAMAPLACFQISVVTEGTN